MWLAPGGGVEGSSSRLGVGCIGSVAVHAVCSVQCAVLPKSCHGCYKAHSMAATLLDLSPHTRRHEVRSDSDTRKKGQDAIKTENVDLAPLALSTRSKLKT